MEQFFGSCTNHGECEEACPKEISIDFIAYMNRDYVKAQVKNRKLLSQELEPEPALRDASAHRRRIGKGRQHGSIVAVGEQAFASSIGSQRTSSTSSLGANSPSIGSMLQ